MILKLVISCGAQLQINWGYFAELTYKHVLQCCIQIFYVKYLAYELYISYFLQCVDCNSCFSSKNKPLIFVRKILLKVLKESCIKWTPVYVSLWSNMKSLQTQENVSLSFLTLVIFL